MSDITIEVVQGRFLVEGVTVLSGRNAYEIKINTKSKYPGLVSCVWQDGVYEICVWDSDRSIRINEDVDDPTQIMVSGLPSGLHCVGDTWGRYDARVFLFFRAKKKVASWSLAP